MSMLCALKRATDAKVAQLLEHPETIREFVGLDPELAAEVARRLKARRGGFWARLFGRQPTLSVEDVQDLLPDTDQDHGDEGDTLELDKAWHGLHFLLAGEAWEGPWPLNFIVVSGEPVGDIDVGYGPARAFTSAEVKEIAGALREISDDDIRARFDADKLAAEDIYPTVWTEAPQEELEWLVSSFGELKPFILETANENLGLVVWLS